MSQGQLKGKHGHSRSGVREEMKQLRREVRKREEAATRDILSRADVVLVTLASASPDSPLKLLEENHFELVVIDECSQVTECVCCVLGCDQRLGSWMRFGRRWLRLGRWWMRLGRWWMRMGG